MPGIVCAIRGGPASQPTIHKAITLATEKDLPIYFLYVVNLDFLNRSGGSHLHALTTELEHMGDFILLTAQTRAEEAGVEAHGVVRHGEVHEQIVELCIETGASHVVLGRPREQTPSNVFNASHLQALAERIANETRAAIVFAEGDAG
ncbi:MAG: universal stress protein [Candidatus Binatia bacterium]